MAPMEPSALWPTPAPLEGVKSRNRPVFKAESVEVEIAGGGASRVSGVALSLESRVVAVGEGGRTVAALLLGERAPASGAVYSHPALAVVHLGPELAGSDATAEKHLVAVAAALRGRPHAVVLEEALARGGGAWARAFAEIIRGEALRSFRGAVVVCVAEETFAVRRACSECWAAAGRQLRQEPVAGRGLEVLEDALRVDPRALSPARKASERRAQQQAAAEFESLVREACELAEYCFEEDLVGRARAEDWTVSLLTEASQDGTRSLRGYLCHKLFPSPRAELHITRLAVPTRHRGRGHARHLMRWVLSEAARMEPTQCASITCSAFDKVVPFYASFGFETTGGGDPHQDDEDPQTWMERRNSSVLSCAA